MTTTFVKNHNKICAIGNEKSNLFPFSFFFCCSSTQHTTLVICCCCFFFFSYDFASLWARACVCGCVRVCAWLPTVFGNWKRGRNSCFSTLFFGVVFFSCRLVFDFSQGLVSISVAASCVCGKKIVIAIRFGILGYVVVLLGSTAASQLCAALHRMLRFYDFVHFIFSNWNLMRHIEDDEQDDDGDIQSVHLC